MLFRSSTVCTAARTAAVHTVLADRTVIVVSHDDSWSSWATRRLELHEGQLQPPPAERRLIMRPDSGRPGRFPAPARPALAPTELAPTALASADLARNELASAELVSSELAPTALGPPAGGPAAAGPSTGRQ